MTIGFVSLNRGRVKISTGENIIPGGGCGVVGNMAFSYFNA